MSFDLLVFPPSGPSTVAEVRRLLDAEEQRLIGGADSALPPLGPEVARFMDEIKHRWPSLEDDPDAVPGPSSPVGNPRSVAGPG
jgi:hypothetical protein